MKISGTTNSRFIGLLLLLVFPLAGCWSYISPEARETLRGRQRPIPVTVYPVNVIRGAEVIHDEAVARQIMAFLLEEDLADPVLGTPPISFPVKWGHDQSAMARRSALAFASRVKATGIETEYALLVEILFDPEETIVVGVHYYLSDREGRLAAGGLRNSHWPEFKEVRPRDRRGGGEVAVRMLAGDWKRR